MRDRFHDASTASDSALQHGLRGERVLCEQEVTFSLGYLPQSFNRTVHAHWTVARKAKAQLQRDLGMVMLATPGLPRPIPGGYVEATAVLLVPDRRRRDEDNFKTPLTKALGDALVAGRWLPDDTPEHYRFGGLEFVHEPDVRATRITLTWRAR